MPQDNDLPPSTGPAGRRSREPTRQFTVNEITHLDTRVGTVERELTDVRVAMSGLRGDVDDLKASQVRIESGQEKISNAIAQLRETRGPSVRDGMILATFLSTMIAAVVAGIFFLVDARVGGKTEEANRFTHAMVDRGEIWVALDRMKRMQSEMDDQVKMIRQLRDDLGRVKYQLNWPTKTEPPS